MSTNATNATSFSVDATASVNFTLPAWTGKPGGMGASDDSNFIRNIFYIGSDRQLYQVANLKYMWHVVKNQTRDFWPLADEPSADLAVASMATTDDVHIYYRVNGSLVELAYDAVTTSWQTATTVPSFNSTETPTLAPTPVEGGGGDLTGGAKAGIAVAVIVGVGAFLAAIGAAYMRWRRRAHQEADAAAAAAAASYTRTVGPEMLRDYAHTPFGSPLSMVAPPYTWPTGHGEPADYKDYVPGRPQELDSRVRPVFEMAEQLYSHEMPGEGHIKEMAS